jgi:hypothetical protein
LLAASTGRIVAVNCNDSSTSIVAVVLSNVIDSTGAVPADFQKYTLSIATAVVVRSANLNWKIDEKSCISDSG